MLPRVLATVCCALLFAPCPVQSAVAQKRPNFLFIYTDDHRWDALSIVQKEQGARGRFPWFQTPNLDRIASEGVRFRNAFVTLSLCAPSRAAYLTGRYNHFNGIASNFRPFPTTNVTHATLLRSAGYTTAYVGKWHMDSQRERPGFDFHASYIGHARYVDANFIVDGKDVPSKGWIDDVATDYALDFIKKQTNASKPWSLVLGFKSPHGPFQPPARTADKFAGENARTVPNLSSPAIYREPRPAVATNADGTVPVNLNYFRCVAAVDDNMGRILRALDDLGIADDTVLIYASDNGYYHGEHGLGDKRSAYDESLRIPLLVRYPRLGTKGKLIDEMALNLDLAPTLLDFAGVQAPKEMQGRSWRPLLESKAPEDWRQSFFYEYFWEQQRNDRTPTHTAVRTTTAKLIKYQDHPEWTELFDLARDPYETQNLYGKASATELQKELEAEYEKQKKAVGYIIPSFAEDSKQGQPRASLASGVVLDYRANKEPGGKVTDRSGHNNHGTANGAIFTEGRNGGEAFRFDGKSHIAVQKAPTLNPAVQAWSIDVTFRPDKASGIVLAHGGASNGYAVSLEDGKVVFTVVGGNDRSRIAAQKEIKTGEWTRVRAGWTLGTISLQVNDAPAITAPLRSAIQRQPFDSLQVGADLGSPVVDKQAAAFTGLIERVRIVAGASRDS